MPSQLVPNPTSLVFGSVVTGSVATLGLQLQNNGDEDCTISSWIIPPPFGPGEIGPTGISAGSFLTIGVDFTAGAPGSYGDNMVIISNDPVSPLTVPMTGTSIAAGIKAIAADPSSWVFDDTKIGTDSAIKIFTITNTGTVAVTVTGTTFTTDFLVAVPVPGYPVVLNAGDSLTLGIKFHPLSEGLNSETVTVQSDAAAGDLSIPVSGTCFLITPAYIIMGSDALIFAFGDTTVKLMDPDNFDCESPAYASNTVMFPFQNDSGSVPGFGYEKDTTRITFHYENLGEAVITVTITTMRGRVVSQNVSIGSVAADGKVNQGIADLKNTDEIVIVTFTKVSGPIQIIDWVGCYVMKGERKKVDA